jgi:hypothetical protein
MTLQQCNISWLLHLTLTVFDAHIIINQTMNIIIIIIIVVMNMKSARVPAVVLIFILSSNKYVDKKWLKYIFENTNLV